MIKSLVQIKDSGGRRSVPKQHRLINASKYIVVSFEWSAVKNLKSYKVIIIEDLRIW